MNDIFLHVVNYQEKRLLASASDDGTVKIWELASLCTGQHILLSIKMFYLSIYHKSHLSVVTFSLFLSIIRKWPLASASDDGTIKIWKLHVETSFCK